MPKKLIIILLFLSLPAISFADEIYYSKPPLGSLIDWVSPGSQSLVNCWLMNERTGLLSHNLVSNKSDSIVKALWLSDGSLNFDTTNSITIQTPTIYLSGTIAIKFNLASTTALQHIVWMGATGGNGYGPEQEIHLSTASSGISLWWVVYTSTGEKRIAYDSIRSNLWYTVCGVYNLITGSSSLIINNLLVGTITATGTVAGTKRYIGKSDGGRNCNARIQYVYIYKRVLQPRENLSLQKAPYTIIKNNYRNFMYAGVFGGAAPPTLTLGSIINNAVINNAIIQ